MDYVTRSLFEAQRDPKPELEDDFARSCPTLSELLDTVRQVEGFPLGRDEDILALSDPTYYTACPNPYLGEFIRRYGKPYDGATDTYQRPPFVADVTEGKNDPVYNAHSYHTKVPHKAIMKYIEHLHRARRYRLRRLLRQRHDRRGGAASGPAGYPLRPLAGGHLYRL